jgi:hypothetical protein
MLIFVTVVASPELELVTRWPATVALGAIHLRVSTPQRKAGSIVIEVV